MIKQLIDLLKFGRLPWESRKFVFYSEGATYWSTFKPVVDELLRRNQTFVFLSSDPADPGLALRDRGIFTVFIGSGAGAMMFLNMMSAGIVVMTTPNLQVLTIKRSPGVRHYVHILHAPTDVSLYRKYAFDHFDTVMCSGEHQIETIRKLEKIRDRPRKNLLRTGCPYMDYLAEQLEEQDIAGPGSGKPVILIAPTWGANGALRRFGMELLRPLLASGFEIIIRPHPQMFKSETRLIEGLKGHLEEDAVSWDEQPSGLESMRRSDVLISDLSGIIFDYAFLLGKPVVSLDIDVVTEGREAEDLDSPPWEIGMREKLGALISESDLFRLPEIVMELMDDAGYENRMKEVRDESLFNFGRVGEVAADQLTGLLEELGV